MDKMSITIRLFGAFRKHGETAVFEVSPGIGIAELKKLLADRLGGMEAPLVADSVFANESEVLPPGTVFQADAQLAILPPVCGG